MSRVAACLAALAFLVVAAQASARPSGACTPPKYPSSGYFESLSVKGVSCATGRKFVLAYYRCRTAHGLAGRCHKHVMGYTCSERRDTIPTEIDARVSCRDGARRIVHTYQQNT
jgi:hypothetical protein